MRKILFMMLCCVTVLLEGCNTIEKEYLLAKEENTVEAYQRFAAKYATTEYAKEARFRAAMIEGTMDAWLNYLQNDPIMLPFRMEMTVCDSVMPVLEKAPMEERLVVYDKTNSILLRDRLEKSIFETDEESAWMVIERVTNNTEKKKDLCRRYLGLYPKGKHYYEVEDWLFMKEIESKINSRSYGSYRERMLYEQELMSREVERRLTKTPKLDPSEFATEHQLKTPVSTRPNMVEIGRRMAESNQRQLELLDLVKECLKVQDTLIINK